MRYHLHLLGLVLAVSLCLPLPVFAVKAHEQACSNCHRSVANPRSMANVCTPCHERDVDPIGRFTSAKASDALGSHPNHLFPALITGDPGDQTSHFWGGSSSFKSAAGSTHPLTTFYSSRYSISTKRVTCTICHDPHKQLGTQLVRATTANDLICKQCHTNWFILNDSSDAIPGNDTNALLTHPIVADYATFAAANSLNYQATPSNSSNGGTGEVRLVNGGVSCTSCHGVHFTDSDSSTIDGRAAIDNDTLAEGDGHLLRADGPGKANKSALCQSCHTYQEHGKVGNDAFGSGVGDVQIGCLVCHSGHSYDETAPNYFVLRKTVDTLAAGFGPKATLYTTSSTSWGSYCGSCHDINNIPDPGLRGAAHSAAEDCTMCHEHNATTYSFGKASSGTACSSCHGAPPRTDTAANRVDNTVPDTGYAVGSNGINYRSANQNGKDETTTPHKRHAGALNDDKVSVDYAFGSGTVLSACLPCHNDKEDVVSPPSATHDTADSNLSFQDVYFNSMATYNGVLTAPLYKKTSGGGQWACSGIYCHSNGGKRRTDGGAKVLADFKTATTPAWPLGSNNTTNIGTIVGIALECQQCHGADRASMVLAQKNNSPTHDKHLLKLGDGKTKCYLCHSATVDSTGTIPAAARDHRFGGTHVNGTVNVVFSTTALNAELVGGTYASGATQGTCVVYCHSDAIGGPPALVPDWDFATGTIVCGSCHGITAATLTSNSHPIHINSAKAKVKCSSCHGLNADTGTHSGHVDGVITKLTTAASCDLCHGVELASGKTWDVSPTWGVAASADCRTCHTGSVVTSYVNTAAVTISVTTANNLSKTLHESDGHSRTTPFILTGKPEANKNCTACHVMPTPAGTGHVDGLGTSKLLIGGFSCEACHTAAGSRNTEATVDVQTHGNQTAGYTKKAYNAAFTKTCLACHDPHGTSNGAMIENLRTKQNAKDATGNYAGNVVFSALILTNSFDESDSGAGVNNDDLCATCHSTTLHNNRAVGGSHHEGENCTTTCHGHNGAKGGFMPSNGTACNDCHGNPPTASDPRPAESVGAHAAHTKVGSHAPSEDLYDCAVCHQGGESFALDGAHSSAPLVAGIGYNAGDGTCSGACHLSTVSDGYWNDSDGLDCASCHYSAANPTSAGNIVKPLSPTHNKHFDAGKVCIDCHADNSADAGAHPDIDLKRTHIDDHDAWSLNATNDGTVLADRGAATQDEATVVVISWNDGANTCSNAACHNPSGLSNTATWGTPNAVGCNFCHSSTNPDTGKVTPGSHGAHMNAAGTFGITTIACTSCHPNNVGSNGHLNGSVSVNGFTYSTSLTDYTSGTFGRCTTTTCHNNGRGIAVQTPVWGATSTNCTICHAAPPTNGRHADHVANTAYVSSSCGSCHANATATTMTGATNHIDGTRNTGVSITSFTSPTCVNACHTVDATGNWGDANELDCIECHTSGKTAGGTYPTSGLHTGTLTVSANTHDNSFKVTKAEGSPTGTCLTCHPGINLAGGLPATHINGGATVAADATLPATVGYLGGATPTCGPNGALVNCHDDKGVWKRKWSTTATASNGTECGNCHGNFDTTWVTGISQRHSSDAQIHGGHNGAGVNDCYICHTFGWAATYPAPISASGKHRDGSIQLNNGMLFNDDGATVHCTGCHDLKPLGLADGQYSFQDTNSADGADGGLNRWLRVEQAGPPANCNGCHALTNGLDHDGTNESLAVHDYHTGSPLAAGCGACHPADSGPGGALHQNNSLDFGGTYLSLTTYAVTPGVGGNFTNTNCSTANGCHNSELNSWKNDSLSGCADCHAATTKLMYTGSGLSGYPPTSNEHEIHNANNAYVGATASSDCDDCHGATSSNPGHLAAHNDGFLTMGSKVSSYTPANGTCTNTCHVTADGRDWTSITTLVCLDCHSGTYLGKANKNHTSGLHAATVATAHDDSFGSGGTCTSCHTAINLTTPVSHVDGIKTDPNTTFGLFANYRTANGDCFANCHADAGDWRRKWTGVVDAKPLHTDAATAAVCGNCHGSFAQGWKFVNEGNATTTDHTDPETVDNTGDQMNTAGHQVCSKCHGWGVSAYQTATKHQNNNLTMNSDLGYNDGTGGCSTNCHAGKTLTMQSNSGFTNDSGAYGVLSCGSCHNDGAIPPNSGAHAAHGANADGDYTECEVCHGTDNGGSWTPGTGGSHNTGTVNFAAGITYSNGGTPGTDAASLNDTCTTTQCHSPAGNSATWGTPASLACNECHYYEASASGANNIANANALSTSHNKHFNKSKVCADCHGTLPTTRTHINDVTGANAGAVLTGKANALQNEAGVTRALVTWDDNANTCANNGGGLALGCHASGTPDWDNTITTCIICHTDETTSAVNPTSGLHNFTVATRHDDTLQTGVCINCHDATSPSSLHQNGTKNTSGTATFTWNATKVLSYNSATGCAANCHADGGDWNRKWTGAVNALPLYSDAPTAAVCDNCHGSFAQGWNFVNEGNASTTDHTDPDADNVGDQMNAAGHEVCTKCHGWGVAGYQTGTKHKNNSLTMNSDLGYVDGTGGCTVNCHKGMTLTAKTNSGFLTDTGAYGAPSCGGCHDDGVIPPNSGAHAIHGSDADADYTECEACHGTNNGGSWATGSGGAHNTGTVTFAAGITYSNGGTAGTNAAAANDTCTTTQCHSAAGNPATWGTPASVGCNACHYYEAVTSGANNTANANALTATHTVHFNKGKLCTDCHGTLPANRTHIAAKAGTDGVVLTLKANAAQNDADPVSRALMTWDDGANTCANNGGGIGNGCHNTKTTPAWGTTNIACTACHVVGGGAAADPASGLHNMTANNVQKHNGTLKTGCTECHSAMTSDPASHIDGTWQADSNANQSGAQPRFLTFPTRTGTVYAEGVANASTCWDNSTSGLDYNAGAGCHRDNGVWKRQWSTNANVDTVANPNPGQLVCDVCHGQYQSLNGSSTGWREGSVHYRSGADGVAENKGDTHNRLTGVTNACQDCHAYASAAPHENGVLNFDGLGTNNPDTFTLTMGTTGWYCATCHNTASGDVATLTTSHTFPDSTAITTRAYVAGTSYPEGGCTGCHGNAGTGGFWPDSSTGHAANTAGVHAEHVREIAKKLYATGSPSVAQQNLTCNYCHPGNTHGGVDGTLPADVGRTDTANDGTPDLELATPMKKIIGGANDTNGFWRRTPGTCSNIACHASAPFTPHWYTDTVLPAAITNLANVTHATEPGTVTLTWTAQGDDGSLDGTAYRYDVRYSTAAINDGNFDAASQGPHPVAKRRNQAQTLDVKGLVPGTTYYFAVKTYDEANNVSLISNLPAGVAAKTDTQAPVFYGISAVSPNDYSFDMTPNPDTNSVNVSWDAARDHSHSLTTPLNYVVLWSEYSLRTHFANGGPMPTTIGTDTCFDKSKTGALLVNAACGSIAPATNEYRVKSAPTTALNYDVPALPVGTVNNFLVRAKDASGNVDSNRAELMALSKTTSFQTIALQTQHTSAIIPTASTGWTGLPLAATSASDAPLGVAQKGSQSTFALTTTPVVFSPTSTYTVKTNVWGLSYQIKINSGATTATTVTYQFGYLTGKAFTGFAADQTLTISRRMPIRLVKFPLGNFKGMVPVGSKPAFVVRASQSITMTYGLAANKGGTLLFNQQDYNDLPTGLGSLSQSDVPSTFIGGNLKRLTWNAAIPVNSGQSVHYDVFASINGGTSYPYTVGRDLTTNSVDWDPVGDGITGNQTNVKFKVLAGDGFREGDMLLGTTNANNENHSVAESTAFTVNNTVDIWTPAAIGSAVGTADDLKVETRPKQGAVNLSWKAVGNDGFNHGTRATQYDIRYNTASINDANWAASTPATNEPKPDFTGAVENYELLGLNPDVIYYFAMKVGDAANNWSPLSNVATNVAGPKCGICHSTPPDESATAGNHIEHGYTMDDCAKCHGNDPTTGAHKFTTAHQDGILKLGWNTPTPTAATTLSGTTITYTQGGTTIYTDTNGAGGFVPTPTIGDGIDTGTCSGFVATNASGCHGPAAPAWVAGTQLACSACHGTTGRTTDQYSRNFDATIDNGMVVPDPVKASPAVDNHGGSTGKYVGAHLKHLNSSFRLAKGDNCMLCHKEAIHADGLVDVAYDLNVTGAGALWTPNATGAGTPGTCGGTNVENCHGTNTPTWDTAATVACNQCHGFGGADPAHVSDNGVRACTWCHPAGHPMGTVQDTNSIMIPNNPLVGISYRSGGIHLHKNINARGIKNTEAEVCWACHDAQGTKVTEWAANNDATTGSSPYNYGDIFIDINLTTATSNWLGAGTGAYWRSGTTAFQTIKKGKIQSTHSTMQGGNSTVAWDATNKRYNESLDAVGDLRCSNCHDVHNMNKAADDTATGTPYLRGTWKGNPYNEDGPPLSTTTYLNVAIGTYGFGAVPRGGTGYRQLGGYFIDQNNVVPMTATTTTNATLADYPTAGWTNESSAGLCILCHGADVDNMDQKTGEALWLGTNGHSNSAIGGTFTNSANIFDGGATTSSLSGRPIPVVTTALSNTQVPDMAYQMQPNSGSTTRGYGYRGFTGTGDSGGYTPRAATTYAHYAYDWGATVDTASVDQMYHQFSCSKCHNPHASRLPKLLITNCLDIVHNSWDDNKSVQSYYTSTALTDVDRITNGNRPANYASAQNCHRYSSLRTAANKGGWTKVSVWTTANQ